MTQAALDLKTDSVDAELWLIGRLRNHVAQIFTAETDPDTRRERLRRAIVNAELDDIIVGKHDGKPENYAQVYERIYGVPLHAGKRGKS